MIKLVYSVFLKSRIKRGERWRFLRYTACCLDVMSDLFPEVEPCVPFDIGKEIGVIDWNEVPENTPVYVRRGEHDIWKVRHFAKYNPGKAKPFICYWGGLSKDTAANIEPGVPIVTAWEQCKLAE